MTIFLIITVIDAFIIIVVITIIINFIIIVINIIFYFIFNLNKLYYMQVV